MAGDGTLVISPGLWLLRRESGSSSSLFLEVLCFVHMLGWRMGNGKLPGELGWVRRLLVPEDEC